MKGVNNPAVLEPAFPGTEKRSPKPDTQFYQSNPSAHPSEVFSGVSERPSLTQNPKVKENLVGPEMEGGCPREKTQQLR